MRSRFTFGNLAQYALGLAFLTLGVVLSFRHGFGGNPGDTLTAITAHLAGITLGTASALIATFYILLLTVAFRTWKFTFLFAQVLVFAPLMDFWDLVVLPGFHPEGAVRVAVLAASLATIPLGSSLLIRSTLPAGIFDELMFLTAGKTGLKPPFARLLNEGLMTAAAVALGLVSGNGLFAVGWGTILHATTVGFILRGDLALYDKLFPRRDTR